MSETTRITTIQITTISNKELELLSEEKQRELADTIKILSGADDVLVKVQDFVMEDTSCNGGKE